MDLLRSAWLRHPLFRVLLDQNYVVVAVHAPVPLPMRRFLRSRDTPTVPRKPRPRTASLLRKKITSQGASQTRRSRSCCLPLTVQRGPSFKNDASRTRWRQSGAHRSSGRFFRGTWCRPTRRRRPSRLQHSSRCQSVFETHVERKGARDIRAAGCKLAHTRTCTPHCSSRLQPARWRAHFSSARVTRGATHITVWAPYMRGFSTSSTSRCRHHAAK